MRTTRARLCAAAAVAFSFALMPAQAEAASSIQVYKIYYDSPGSDTGSNSSLNAEYIQLKNHSSSAIQLQGYKIKDSAGFTYTFPSYKISAGKTVKVHTGAGEKSSGHVYWGRTWYVWNNTSDKALVYKANGTLADSCAYNSSSADYKMC